MSVARDYALRYKVEDWGKPPELLGQRVANNVTVSGDDHGYCDHIFIASIMHNVDGPDVLLLCEGGEPPVEMLRLVRDAINEKLGGG